MAHKLTPQYIRKIERRASNSKFWAREAIRAKQAGHNIPITKKILDKAQDLIYDNRHKTPTQQQRIIAKATSQGKKVLRDSKGRIIVMTPEAYRRRTIQLPGGNIVLRRETSALRRERDIDIFVQQKLAQYRDKQKVKQRMIDLQKTTLSPEKLKTVDPNKPLSVIEPRRDKNIIKTLSIKRGQQISRLQQAGVGVPEKMYRGIIVLGVIGGLRGMSTLFSDIRHPIKAAKAVYGQARHPFKTIKAMGQTFEIDPVGTVAEFYVYGKALGITGKSIKRSPVGRFVAEELYIRSQPEVLRPYIRSIIKSAKVQENINPANVKKIKAVDFYEVKSLTKTEARALSKTLRQTDSVVFGSVVSRTFGKTTKKSMARTPLPKDVDLATSNGRVFNQVFLKNIPKAYRGRYTLKKGKIYRGSQPILDVKSISRLYPSKIPLIRKGYLPVTGYVRKLVRKKGSIIPRVSRRPGLSSVEFPTKRKLKISGIKITGFGEQTVRKALGTLQVLIEKNARRAKDPQSFVISLETQLDFLRRRVKKRSGILRARDASKIKIISNALKILKSKDFVRILEKKVPGISKMYPLVAKISIPKLKKVIIEKPIVRNGFIIKKVRGRKVKLRIPKRSRITTDSIDRSSIIPQSYNRRSSVPVAKKSRIPRSGMKSELSNVPRRTAPTVLKSSPKSGTLSRLNPSNRKSRIPSIRRRTSQVPSRITSNKSRLRTIKLSKIPGKPSRIRGGKYSTVSPGRSSRLKGGITRRDIRKNRLDDNEKTSKEKKIISRAIHNRDFIYIADLASIISGKRATKAQAVRLKKVGKIFSGIELRLIINMKGRKKR